MLPWALPVSLLLQRVLQAADGILDLPLGLVALALSSQLRVTGGLTNRLLDRALGFLGRASDAIFVHVVSLRSLMTDQQSCCR